MKKFFSMMAVLAAMFAFVACSETPGEPDQPNNGKKQKLATPVLTETHTETGFTVKWDAVEGADSYLVNFNSSNKTITECEFKVENLNAGTYKVKVKAKGNNYEDSDMATIEIELSGLTSVDWFTQELSALKEPVEFEDGSVAAPYNALAFNWKGTGITDVKWCLWTTADAEDLPLSEIKSQMSTFSNSDLQILLPYIHSAEGYSNILSGLSGGTSYTLYTLVTNEEGLEYMAVSTLSTANVEATDETKAWYGTWTVKSHNIYSLDDQGKGTVGDKEDEFTVTISASQSAPNEVVIDGFSVMGSNWPTYGVVYGNELYILNGVNLGYDQQRGFYYYWVGFYSDPVRITIQSYPSNIVTLAEGGDAAASTNEIPLNDANGNPITVTCYCSDVMGVSDNGGISFFIEAFPAVFRTGNMEWTKTSNVVAPAAQNANVRTVKSALKSSIFVK